jgi:hypothetical protein
MIDASTHSHLLIFTAPIKVSFWISQFTKKSIYLLDTAGTIAVTFVNCQVVFSGKTTVALGNTDVNGFGIIFNIFHRNFSTKFLEIILLLSRVIWDSRVIRDTLHFQFYFELKEIFE